MVSAKENDSHTRLKDIQMIIKEVYLPTLGAKPDIKHNISKFSNQINTALQQAYGNVTIYVPKISMSNEEVRCDRQLTEQLTQAVADWTEKIKETVDKENKRAAERSHNTAQGETNYWQLRSATFNTLYQQLSMQEVKRITQILKGMKDGNDSVVLNNYESEFKLFQIQWAQAKDFVKFLTTLERQFKNISNGDLKGITETMYSLLNGLKLIWTISKHISHEEEEFEKILEAISNEICQKVRDKIDIRTIFTKYKPDQAIEEIEGGITVLDKWVTDFHKTKTDIESETTITRWDFTNLKSIFEKPRHMIKVLHEFKETCIVMKEFFAILNDDLKAVTGSSTEIVQVSSRVTDAVQKLASFEGDVFLSDSAIEQAWRQSYAGFQNTIENIEEETVNLIRRAFEKTSSSVNAFALLDNFREIKTRPRIEQELKDKYDSVLLQYEKELQQMEQLFETNHMEPPIPKNMPPSSGAIKWARSIITRVKTPIEKFKSKPAMLTTQAKGKQVAKAYVQLAKKLTDEYESKKYNTQMDRMTNEAIQFLKENILTSTKDSDSMNMTFKVNFNPKLKVYIREAKFLDRIGLEIPHTIVSIALQDKEYMHHVDKLNQLLRSYNSALGDLRNIERGLLQREINKLNSKMKKGMENHNWFSLSISTFIKECQSAIDSFKEIKGRVLQHARNIEKQVQTISDSVIMKDIDFRTQQILDMTQFSEYFENYRVEKVNQLVKDYQNIGDINLKAIEESTFKTSSQNKAEMKKYYAYWERKIFNAINTMIIRAMATNKALLSKQRKPLIQTEVSYQHPDISYHPSTDELCGQLEKFNRNILDTPKRFGRWWDGWCKCFEETIDKDTGEKTIKYSFFDDVNLNPVVAELNLQLVSSIQMIQQRFEMNAQRYTDDHVKYLFDNSEMSKVQKFIEKQGSVNKIEAGILRVQMRHEIIQSKPSFVDNYLIRVDYRKVLSAAREQYMKWREMFGRGLQDFAKKDLNWVLNEIRKYDTKLETQPTTIDSIKELLNVINEIQFKSLDIELKINEVLEQFRVLKLYQFAIEPEEQEQVDMIQENWDALVEKAEKKDFEVNEFKTSFAEVTKQNVNKFKEELKVAYEEYLANGPGAEHISLDEGVQILKDSMEKCEQFNFKKEDFVLSEALFNLPISKFNELIEMEKMNKEYKKIYKIFEAHKEMIAEHSVIPWNKLEAVLLENDASKFEKDVKKLANELTKELGQANGPDTIPPFVKLRAAISGFKTSIPFITQLNHPAVVERHWIRIMEETGKDFGEGEFNLKSITLAKVFELELQHHAEKVQEICKEAQEEQKNEETIEGIRNQWKTTNFEVREYSMGGFTIKGTDEIKLQLEDDIALLQIVGSSKYSRSVKKKVAQWESDLNRVFDVIQQWLDVQRKWVYLLSIFSSEDIRIALPEEAKKFAKTDTNYKKIMDSVFKIRNVLNCCVTGDAANRLDELMSISRELDKCEKSLVSYLEDKRCAFPRFYFISDEDLLEILGTSDPQAIQPHMLKLFDNCSRLIFAQNGKIINAMVSEEGEQYSFETAVKPEGNIEQWMNKVDEEMKKTLHVLTKKATFYYAQETRIEWVLKHLGMVTLVGTQIWWTFAIEDVFKRIKERNEAKAMKDELAKENQDVLDLIQLVRQDLDSNARKVVNTLIILDEHARSIVENFVRDSVLTASEFDWEKQLRFYWDNNKDNIVIKQCTGTFSYCYEYQGLNGRLVITPLTDRCVMTLTTALTFYLGGSPAGPAGTGKTETVKDLAKGLAIRCVVTNCGETMDYKAMEVIFSGLIQTGFWGCFDEFNRINVEVLSVVSIQIKIVQNGLVEQKQRILFNEIDMRLIPTVGIFITMNPGYAGRSELPDNLKALFRPVVMAVPDLLLICENMLMSEGFSQAKQLAKKMTVLYKLAREQLSKQHHYDFGLRALKSVLVMAGNLKRTYSDLPEDVVLMRALRDMNMPKFVFDDVPLFYGLISDLFPGLKAERVGQEDLKELIIEYLDKNKYRHTDDAKFEDQVNKVIQLNETIETRHTTMVVGPTGSGKSVIVETLANALKEQTDIPTDCKVINPKSITTNELYGVLDPSTRDWTDGLLSKIFKNANKPVTPEMKKMRNWIIYDGDVDAKWVENMNSVMDDNRLLTLTNGDRIPLQRHTIMLFEVYDLQYASPATISRCGMVYVDPKNLGYEPYYQKWLRQKLVEYNDTMRDSLKDLFLKYVSPVMERIYEGNTGEELVEPLRFITPRTNLNLVIQLCNLIDTVLGHPDETPMDTSELERPYLFCLTWSCGGALVMEDREKFNSFISSIATVTVQNLYDVCYDMKTYMLDTWERNMAPLTVPEDGKLSQVIVPTVDTTRYSWLLRALINKEKPVLFCGDSGTAKTVTVQAGFKQMDGDKYSFLNVNFSSRTSSMDFQTIIEENIEKKSIKAHGPKGVGKKMIMFIDDMNMPTIDEYGTQAPLALLKFLVERNELYQRGGDLELRNIKDIYYVGCISPPGGSNNRVDPRVMSLYNVFNITFPSKESIQKIYSTLLSKHLQDFNDEIPPIVETVTQATLQLYFQCCEKLPRTPIKFHYTFNLRDIGRIYEGLYLTCSDKFKTKANVIKCWRNEAHRVFADRLLSDKDMELVTVDLIPGLINQYFKDCSEEVLQNPLLFGDFALTEPEDEDDGVEDPRLYEDLKDFETVRKKMDVMLESYNEGKSPMNLVLFNDALQHLTRIHRMIRFPKGCGLLIGFGGSGKQSLTKLATFVAKYDLFTINLVRGYKEEDFREDLRNLYRGVLKKPKTFMFTDGHVQEEGFLELINNILTIGMVPSLFPEEEKESIMSPLDQEIRKKKLPETKEFRWGYYVNRAREQLHIMLCMSPAGETLRIRARSFPGLINNSYIDWFFPWPQDALNAVATHFIKDVVLPEELKPRVIDHVVMIHQSIQKYSEDFLNIYKRRNFSTPKNYLDFISQYKKFLYDKRIQLDRAVTRLTGGLATLEKTSVEVEALREDLEVQNDYISEKKAEVEVMIEEITAKKETATMRQNEANTMKKKLDADAIIIEEERQAAEIALQAAQPAVEAAQAALLEVNAKDLNEVKALANPPEAVKLVCTLAFYLKEEDLREQKKDDWPNVKVRLLNNMRLLQELQDYKINKCKAEMAKNAKKQLHIIQKEYKKSGDELVAHIKSVSKPAAGLFKWAVATDQYYDIFKEVEPKKKKAKEMKEQSEKSAAELKKIQEELAELNAMLSKLERQLRGKQDELNDLMEKQAAAQKKLDAAGKLIKGLGSEQKRWTADMENFKVDKIKLDGDCLTAAAFLSYTGPFNFILRKKMIFEHWKIDLIEKEIPNKEDFNLATFLSNDVEVSAWASQGLPSDELSIQNGILTKQASRWPLCIDPQMQAVNWIKEKEKKNNMKILSFNQSDYFKQLELAIQFGSPVLFENISTEIDPMIDPVLEQNIVTIAGQEMIIFGDKKVEYSREFSLFLTTKLPNPNYTPEIFGKTMVINFNVTLMGLRDQLLIEVVAFERPELAQTRKDLVARTAQNKAELKEIEDLLLSELAKEQKIPIVQNDELIAVLENAKAKADKIEGDLVNAKTTSLEIEQSMESYKPVAKRGAILFFALTGLSAISEMYEYSLSSYLTVFLNALATSKKDNVLQARLRFIIEKLTQLVYEFTCMGIFERHKLMFSFQMTTMIMDGEDELNREEMDFFLKGNTSLDGVVPKPHSWMSNDGWKDAVKLAEFGGCWANLLDDIKENGKAWKKWYDLETPEDSPLPLGYSEKINEEKDKFKRLLLIRIFRPDRVINAIKRFIIAKMSGNEFYVKSPPIVYKKVLQQSTERTPIVFILSPGADPQSEVARLIEEEGIGTSKFHFLALGQGMEETAKQYIERGTHRGQWVMLQNCHLLVKWLPKLEAIIEQMTKPDKAFRLWLTTEPTDKFPLGILQKSLKVVTEPPDGLAANIKQNFKKLNDDILAACPREEFKSLVYVLSFFHATIQERKKYGKIGWNVQYDFNDSDFRISWQLINLYLTKSVELEEENLPWDTLRYLIGEAMYGGRVTDDWDRRIVNTYLAEFMGDFIFDQNQKFYFSRSDCDYTIPQCEDMEHFMIAIDEIPLFTNPGVFGLHTNAEIQYFTNAAKDLWKNTLEMQTSDGGSSGAVNREEYIEKVAAEISEKLPECFDIPNVRKQFDTPSPTQIVLLQELERFNMLLENIQTSLFDLQRALVGEIGMSAALDELAGCIFNGFVPSGWLRLAPDSQKNLVNWIEHFERRFAQYKDWAEVEEPKVIWLSGLQIPESYLTALLQTTCRARGWPLDKSTLYTVVTQETNAQKINKRLEAGTYIQGLYLEGARWNIERDCLDYQLPKQLVTEMPLIRIVPIEANKLKLRGTIKTPVYVTQARKNAMGKGEVFVADLRSDMHESHWVLQGVALSLNIA